MKKPNHKTPTWSSQASDYFAIRVSLFSFDELKRGDSAKIYEKGNEKGIPCSYSHFKKLLPLAEMYEQWQKSSRPHPKRSLSELGDGVAIAAMMSLLPRIEELQDRDLLFVSNQIDEGKFGAFSLRALSALSRFDDSTPLPHDQSKVNRLSDGDLEDQPEQGLNSGQEQALRASESVFHVKAFNYTPVAFSEPTAALPFSDYAVDFVGLYKVISSDLEGRPLSTLPEREFKLLAVVKPLNKSNINFSALRELAKSNQPIDLLMINLPEDLTPAANTHLSTLAREFRQESKLLSNEQGKSILFTYSEQKNTSNFCKEIMKSLVKTPL